MDTQPRVDTEPTESADRPSEAPAAQRLMSYCALETDLYATVLDISRRQGAVLDVAGGPSPAALGRCLTLFDRKDECLTSIAQIERECEPLKNRCYAGQCTPAERERLNAVLDDILDITQTTEKLGKSAGKDIVAGKATYPSILGLDASRAEAGRLTAKAYAALDIFGDEAARLRLLAEYLLNRDY